MVSLQHSRRSVQIFCFMICCGFLFIKCIDRESKKDISGIKYEQYAGSSTCINCHKAIYDSHVQTAHFLTSQRSDQKNIKGSFDPGQNTFSFKPNVYVAAEKRGALFYQVAYINGTEKMAQPFDITVGSGKRGQTFLFWRKNNLFQLPLTYFTSAKQWSNSPGYSNKVVFNRPITSRCLECHSTYFEKTSAEDSVREDFSKTKIVYGVDCEKCHGPAAQHVDFHQKNPNEKKGRYIIDPRLFTREQSLENCRLCHGGKLTKSKPSFSFTAGDKLSEFFTMDTTTKSVADIDVHGNSYGRLIASQCFIKSQMTCNTCHNSHENETGKLSLFSQRCMGCHTEKNGNFCKEKAQVGNKIVKNCIDCHMPELPSKAIMVLLQGNDLPTSASMRSHFISVYPEETKKYLLLNKMK